MKLLQNHWNKTRFLSLLLFFFSLLSSTAMAVERNNAVYSANLSLNNSPISLDEQLILIDAEINLLKAELALQNAELTQVKNYIVKLMLVENVLKVTMKQRFQTLQKAYYSALENNVGSTKNNKNAKFRPELSSILVLLPQSGDYADVGNEIIAGIEENSQLYGFADNIRFLDTQSHQSMFELWELAKRYNPSFIIGPLIKDNIAELDELNINLPTLYLNQVKNIQPYARSISLTREHHLDSLLQYLEQSEGSIGILFDSSNNSLDYKAQLEEKFREQDREVVFQKVGKSVDLAVKKLMNSDTSYARKSWLEKTISTPLQYNERVRSDIDRVVSLLPARSAMQVKTLLQYYHLNFVEHIWLPSKLPLARNFVRGIGGWEKTTAILPSYFVNQFNRQQQPKQLKSFKKGVDNLEEDKLGIFYALGKLAIEAVVKVVNKDSSWTQSSLGELVIDEQNRMTLQTKISRINKGSLSVIEFPSLE